MAKLAEAVYRVIRKFEDITELLVASLIVES